MALVTFRSSPVTWLWVPVPVCYLCIDQRQTKEEPTGLSLPAALIPPLSQPVSRLAFLYKCIYNAGASGTLRGLIKLKLRPNFLLIH